MEVVKLDSYKFYTPKNQSQLIQQYIDRLLLLSNMLGYQYKCEQYLSPHSQKGFSIINQLNLKNGNKEITIDFIVDYDDWHLKKIETAIFEYEQIFRYKTKKNFVQLMKVIINFL